MQKQTNESKNFQIVNRNTQNSLIQLTYTTKNILLQKGEEEED